MNLLQTLGYTMVTTATIATGVVLYRTIKDIDFRINWLKFREKELEQLYHEAYDYGTKEEELKALSKLNDVKGELHHLEYVRKTKGLNKD
jgi:hypothetical protein